MTELLLRDFTDWVERDEETDDDENWAFGQATGSHSMKPGLCNATPGGAAGEKYAASRVYWHIADLKGSETERRTGRGRLRYPRSMVLSHCPGEGIGSSTRKNRMLYHPSGYASK
ncbi:hypothetical protein N7475_000282 [Penicillium sp. IBT 31633x]|nr:hypothetical protein N7475_000282 [Penicillium sp. IBT 31633x]